MIGYIRGNLVEVALDGSVIVDVNGVGYVVMTSPSTAAVLGETGDEIQLHVHTRVREDAISLYGFRTSDEKRCFEALIATHGVGPSMAIALLTSYSPSRLRQLVVDEDASALSQVPGIGKKTAARLLVELKTRFESYVALDVESGAGPVVDASDGGAKADVTQALQGLGYSNDEIRKVLGGLPDETDPSQLLRLALRELAVA